MKKLLFISLIFLANPMFAKQKADRQDQNSTSVKVEIPADFFNGMFRAPDDDFLVAWHGMVKVAAVYSSDNGKAFSGSIKPFVQKLNEGWQEIADEYFDLNMKDGKKQIVSEDEKVWAARCGLKSGSNVFISPVTKKPVKAYPADITSDVWSNNFSFKRNYPDPDNPKKRIVITYRIEAVSIYFYHKALTSLKGKLEREDGFQLCGRILFQRMGPGIAGTMVEDAYIKNGQYEYVKRLHRCDCQVSYLWPHGGSVILNEDFVYNPTNPTMDPDFTIKTFVGEISGTARFVKSKKMAAYYPVTLVPYCAKSRLPEKETITGKDGAYTFHDVPEGEYKVMVTGAEPQDAFLTNRQKPKIKVGESEISFTSKYEIYAYYNAPGFAKVSLKWPASEIAFPDEGASPQVVSYQSLMQADPNAKMEDFHDDNGKPIHLPFTIVYPQQKHTIYGGPGEDGTTVLYVGTLGGNGFYKNFDVKLSSDALNSCEISRENNGPIYLNLGFDLYGGAGQKGPNHQISPNWEQLTVTAWDPKTFLLMGQKMKRNPWPVDFSPILITKEDIEKFNTGQKVEKRVSNGRATLKIVFVPEK